MSNNNNNNINNNNNDERERDAGFWGADQNSVMAALTGGGGDVGGDGDGDDAYHALAVGVDPEEYDERPQGRSRGAAQAGGAGGAGGAGVNRTRSRSPSAARSDEGLLRKNSDEHERSSFVSFDHAHSQRITNALSSSPRNGGGGVGGGHGGGGGGRSRYAASSSAPAQTTVLDDFDRNSLERPRAVSEDEVKHDVDSLWATWERAGTNVHRSHRNQPHGINGIINGVRTADGGGTTHTNNGGGGGGGGGERGSNMSTSSRSNMRASAPLSLDVGSNPTHAGMAQYESLDYEQSVNVPFLRSQTQTYLGRHLGSLHSRETMASMDGMMSDDTTVYGLPPNAGGGGGGGGGVRDDDPSYSLNSGGGGGGAAAGGGKGGGFLSRLRKARSPNWRTHGLMGTEGLLGVYDETPPDDPDYAADGLHGAAGAAGGGGDLAQAHKPRKAYGYSGKTFTRWIITWSVGVVIGIVGYVLGKSCGWLVNARNDIFFKGMFEKGPGFLGYLGFTCWNLALVAVGSALSLWVAPGAAGSGIPEVKAYLNGVRIRHFFSFYVFWVKLIGTVLAVSSGLVVGPEGPMVHLGAIVGSGFTSGRKQINLAFPNILGPRFGPPWFVRRINFDMKFLMRFRSDRDRRDFISIGAAAGFAAAFGAPIGGVMFALEEAASFWSPTLMWRTLTATLMSIFTLLMLSNMDAPNLAIPFNDYGLISLSSQGTASEKKSTVEELPLFAMLGVLGGMLGALFNYLWEAKMQRHKALPPKTKFMVIMGASLFTSSLLYFLTFILQDHSCAEKDNFRSRDDDTTIDDVTDDDNVEVVDDKDFWLEFGCNNANQTNVLASVFFQSREVVIKKLLEDAKSFDTSLLVVMLIAFFPLMVLGFGLAIPTGVFMPTILVGCIGGALFGKIVIHFKSMDHDHDGYLSSLNNDRICNHMALVGAVALLGGIQRSTLSLCVIIMEGTGQVQMLIPIIITTVISRYFGNLFTEGLYEIGLHLKHVPFLHNHIAHQYYMMRVCDVMQPNVVTLTPLESVGNILNALRHCTHNGFPVVTSGGNLCGVILRSQLRMLLKNRIFFDAHVMRGERLFPGPSFHGRSSSIDEALQVPLHARQDDYALNSHQADLGEFSDAEREMKVNLLRIMNQGPHVVLDTCPLSRAYSLFISVGLRHLVVLDTTGQVVGILTRKDLVGLMNYKPVIRQRHEDSRRTETLIPQDVMEQTRRDSQASVASMADSLTV